jgi:DNA-binding NarL/FixJ family response regulator
MSSETPKIITVAIVEDESPLRASFEEILNRAPGIRCVGAYANAETALRDLPECNPHVVIMDINLPNMDGVECVRRLSELLPKVQIIMLTVHDNPDAIFNSLAAGASGYMLKPVRAAQLVEAVKDVITGGAPITSNIARKLVQTFKKPAPAELLSDGELTPKEIQVLDYLAKGYLYKEIADALKISYSTVHTHIEHIYDKLHVRSRSQAIAKYLRAS